MYNTKRYVTYLVPSARKAVDPVDVAASSMSNLALSYDFVKLDGTSLAFDVCTILYFRFSDPPSCFNQIIRSEPCPVSHDT